MATTWDVTDRLVLVLSYVLGLVALPAHAWRLLQLRLSVHRRRYTMALTLGEEVEAVRAVIDAAGQIEQELAKANLTLEVSRRTAVAAAQRSLMHLRQQVGGTATDDTPCGRCGHTGQGDRL